MANAIKAGLAVFVVSAFFEGCCGQSAACMQAAGQCIMAFSSSQRPGIAGIDAVMSQCGQFSTIAGCLDAVQGDQQCRTEADYFKANVQDVLVDSKLCDRKEEVKGYETCFAKRELENVCENQPSGDAGSDDLCSSLTRSISCWTKKVEEVCGESEADFVQDYMKVMSRNIAKNLKKSCPGLESSSSVTSASLMWTFLVLLFPLFAVA